MCWFFILKVIPVSKLLLKQPLALMAIFLTTVQIFIYCPNWLYYISISIDITTLMDDIETYKNLKKFIL
jgi:hypothetical protein